VSREVVRRLWELFEAREWEQAGELLADDFVADWLQTGERIRGRENYIELNRNYPGDWSITVKRVLAEGDVVASEIVVTEPAAGTFHAAIFFEFRDAEASLAMPLRGRGSFALAAVLRRIKVLLQRKRTTAEPKIARATEYWIDPPSGPPPAWRSQWVEPL
jgi:SnoaL-like protein